MINVIVGFHEPIFRTGVANLLAAEDDLRIIAQPVAGPHLRNALDKLRPHVVVLSSGFFPALADVEALSRVCQRRGIGILMLTENSEKTFDLFSLGLGVRGVLYRCVSGNLLVNSVRRVARGEMFVQTHAASDGQVSSTDMVGTRVTSKLSRRELRITAAIAQGFKNRDIAMRLGTSEQMIKNAVRVIFDKTGVSDRLELALFVMHHQVLATAAASQPLLRMKASPDAVRPALPKDGERPRTDMTA
jgi:DNA-binding NarL/FixJ family response regulator